MKRYEGVKQIDIGSRLKAVRASRNLSQRELARLSGVTNGMISQIEQNHSSPSVASLKRILDAIPMTLAEFFGDGGTSGRKVFYRAGELFEINPSRLFHSTPHRSGAMSFRQVGPSGIHSVQMLHETYAPNADTGEELYSHVSEEAGIIISGRIELTVGNETRSLGPGDAYIFDSRIPHRFRNTDDTECIIVSACAPPSF